MHRPKRLLGMIVWLLAALLIAGPASAQRVEGDRAEGTGLYSAEIPVRSQSESCSGVTRASAGTTRLVLPSSLLSPCGQASSPKRWFITSPVMP